MSKFPPELIDNVGKWNLGDELEDNLYDAFTGIRPIIEKYMVETIDEIFKGLKLRISVDEDEEIKFVLWGDNLIGDTGVVFSLNHVLHESAFDAEEKALALADLQKRLTG